MPGGNFAAPSLTLPGALLLGVAKFATPSVQPTRYEINGITKDSAGAVLPTCVVDIFETATDTLVASVISNAEGRYSAAVSGKAGLTFYAVAYKALAPDVAGTTVNTLIATVA